MRHIGILYDGSDAEDWFVYLFGMLDLSDRVKLTKGSINVAENDPSSKELTKFINDSLVLVLLLSPGMCQILEEQSDKYSQCLKKHTDVVLIMCFTQKEDLDTFSKQCPSCLSWKMLQKSDSKSGNQMMMSEIVEMVDKLQKKRCPQVNPKPRPRQQKVKIIPESVYKIHEPIVLIFPEETDGNIQIGFQDTDTLYNTVKLNPYTYQFKAPSIKPGLTKLKIYKDGREIYAHPFTFVEPKLASYQCAEMLAQCLGTSGHEELDFKLCEIYEKSFSQDDVISKMLKPTAKPSVTKSCSEIPTILHFAAKNGLSEFCATILDTADSMTLFETENLKRINCIDNLFVPNNTSCLHSGLLPKPKSFKYNSKKSTDSPESSTSVPVVPNIGCHPFLTELTQVEDQSESTDDNEEDLYADKRSLIPVHGKRPPPPPPKKSSVSNQSPAEFMGIKAPPIPKRPSKPQEEDIQQNSGESQSQKELIEIAKGVKTGEFTLDEAERLYSAWRERNSSQSTSMKERKKMLEEMRNEYKSVFDASKKKDSTFGRLSVFSKFKKWGKRKKSEPDLNISKPIARGKGSRYTKFPGQGAIPEDKVCTEGAFCGQLDPRFSTLSNSSSSSSASSGSRDSRTSFASRESSISESFDSSDSDADEVTEKIDSGMDSDGQVSLRSHRCLSRVSKSRHSLKVEFLEKYLITDNVKQFFIREFRIMKNNF
ncbi:hypothetical protein KUTeg_004366 [Tegillarca granosa]|uniref:DBB domain-containing protein n=1 Tax=Tegillarca granosa TaxID=220873 RepID=A0ABQ9FU92_TEGGR|nr:hypothetical protein KUTeg_004366 [Tegillarca granosa]